MNTYSRFISLDPFLKLQFYKSSASLREDKPFYIDNLVVYPAVFLTQNYPNILISIDWTGRSNP